MSDTELSSSEAVLTSLPLLDELRSASNTASNEWTRQPGSNLDVLPRDPSSNRSSPVAICHLDNLLPFTEGDKRAVQARFEEGAAVALAAHHLNVGDGSIVPQVKELNQRCNIQFTLEYADTEYSSKISLEHVVQATGRQPGIERLPCAFIGAYRSSISIPTSILTGIRNYPQISAGSTSANLDDTAQYRLFARTIPSDHGNAVPIIQFLHQVLGINHLAVINVNDAYGNSFVRGLRLAAEVHAPEMKIRQAPVDDDIASIRSALQAVKETEYRYIFGIVFTEQTHDAIMTEAYNMRIAGTGEHQWLFGDSFNRVHGRVFEANSPLNLAYRGVGMLEATGGVPNIGLEGYENFLDSLAKVKNPVDLEYLFSLFPSHNEPEFQESIDDFRDFLTPAKGAQTAFIYEATIALGLAACSVSPGVEEDAEFALDGKAHFDEMVTSVFQSLNGDLVFDHITGSRQPSHTLYKVTNFVDKATSGGDEARFEEVFTHIYREGEWEELNTFVFNDGSSNPPPDIPPLQLDEHQIILPVRICILFFFGMIAALVVGLVVWTQKNRKARVVLASQPFFLHTICIGVLVLGSAIIPLSIDHGLVSLQGCDIACISLPWLAAMGFSTTVSALFTKTHRINIILSNANKLQRVKVTICDVAKPMLVLLSMNTILLSIMSAIAPAEYEMISEKKDDFGRADEIRGQCNFSASIPYIASVCAMNFGALVLTVIQGLKARDLSTEFAESAQIFRALISIMMVVFVGGPVMLLSRDNSNTFAFVASAIIFVTCCCILLLLFIPKIQILRQSRQKLPSRRVHISGIEMSEGRSSRISVPSDSINDTEECTGMKILTTKTPQELVQEVEELKRLLRKAREVREEDLGEEQDASQIFYKPTTRVKSILKKESQDSISTEVAKLEDDVAKSVAKIQDIFKSEKSTDESLAARSTVSEGSVKGETTSPSQEVGGNTQALGMTPNRLDSLREKREAAKEEFERLRKDSSVEQEQCLERSQRHASDAV